MFLLFFLATEKPGRSRFPVEIMDKTDGTDKLISLRFTTLAIVLVLYSCSVRWFLDPICNICSSFSCSLTVIFVSQIRSHKLGSLPFVVCIRALHVHREEGSAILPLVDSVWKCAFTDGRRSPQLASRREYKLRTENRTCDINAGNCSTQRQSMDQLGSRLLISRNTHWSYSTHGAHVAPKVFPIVLTTAISYSAKPPNCLFCQLPPCAVPRFALAKPSHPTRRLVPLQFTWSVARFKRVLVFGIFLFVEDQFFRSQMLQGWKRQSHWYLATLSAIYSPLPPTAVSIRSPSPSLPIRLHATLWGAAPAIL